MDKFKIPQEISFDLKEGLIRHLVSLGNIEKATIQTNPVDNQFVFEMKSLDEAKQLIDNILTPDKEGNFIYLPMDRIDENGTVIVLWEKKLQYPLAKSL